jgi:hypothetical protein
VRCGFTATLNRLLPKYQRVEDKHGQRTLQFDQKQEK